MSVNQEFALGQRWLSNTESELGLGTVVAIDDRMVHILYPATGESRAYSANSAPLTRITFSQGETLTCHEGWQIQVESVDEQKRPAFLHRHTNRFRRKGHVERNLC